MLQGFLYQKYNVLNSKDLKKQYPEYNFVPVYWMATEDHDFEEINFFNFQGKKVQWSKAVSGAVGELSLEGLDEVCKVFSGELGPRDNFGPVTVPGESYFVMGDNRDQSFDSRFWGFVRKNKIKGIVQTVYWSWDGKMHTVRWNRIGLRIH